MSITVSNPPLKRAMEDIKTDFCPRTQELISVYLDCALAIATKDITIAQRPKIFEAFIKRRIVKLDQGTTAWCTIDHFIKYAEIYSYTRSLRVFESWYLAFFGEEPYNKSKIIKKQFLNCVRIAGERDAQLQCSLR